MEREFVFRAVNELRRSIQPILGLAELLRTNEKDQQQQELLDIIIRNATRLKQFTEDLLDVTRIESNTLQLNKKEFDLKHLVISIIEDYKNQISPTSPTITTAVESEAEADKNKNALRVVYDDSDTKILVHADRHRINQVISNLISNSIKFRDPAGTISVKIIKNKDFFNDRKTITVSVKHTGTGIDPQIMPRLFTKFFVEDNLDTGLELFISKSIIEAHGGKMWAENNTDGKGATFHFSLPSH